MPKKILPTEQGIKYFDCEMRKMSYRVLNRLEFRKDFVRLGLIAPRRKPGREIGYRFFSNGLEAIVWTTFLVGQNKPREEDLGWALIREGDKVLYFSHPIRRTKGFIRKLLSYAWLVRHRVEHRPLCPECKDYMKVARGKGLKSRYWICMKKSKHKDGKPVFLDWDWELGPRAIKFLKKERKARRKYHQQRKKEGKSTDQAMLKRKKWKTMRPENVK